MASRCFSQAQALSFQANKPYKVFNREVIKGSLSPNDKFLKRKLTLASRSPLSHSNVLRNEWSSFFSAPNILLPPTRVSANIYHRRNAVALASWAGTSQIASGAFTLGTAFVIPFYALMVLAPHSEWTKRSMESNIPYVALGALYAYLLCLSWTSETLRLMFASKYWLPELPGITRMFSSDLTVASAWLHLLAVDLFAARQVFRDGLKDGIETRHSIVLCLLFCPIGIMSHIVTKAITHLWRGSNQKSKAAANIAAIYRESE